MTTEEATSPGLADDLGDSDVELGSDPLLQGSRAGSARSDGGAPPTWQDGMSIWVFVLGDMLIFGGYFIIFMFARARTPDAYLSSQAELNEAVGVVNTLVLLASSWLVVKALQAAREDEPRRASRLLTGAGVCGLVFMAVKAWEWHAEITAGHTLGAEPFFTFYFTLTGAHLLHVGIGLIVLGAMRRNLRKTEHRQVQVLEAGAAYWHMVDLLWIVLFVLLYLMR